MEASARRGLGRGLGAIIPGGSTAEPLPREEQEQPERDDDVSAPIVDEVIEAGLDALQHALGDLDVCAYLHLVDGGGPELHLRALVAAPEGPFRVSKVMADLLADGSWTGEVRDARLAGVPVVAIRTTGLRSHGLHAVGRRNGPLTDEEHATAVGLCRALGAACHSLEAPASRPSRSRLPHPTRVTVQLSEGVAHAEVAYLTTHGLEAAHARAGTPALAVAAAMVAASGEQVRVADVTEVVLDRRPAVVVLVERDGGRDTGVGSAAIGGDPQRAVALAALDALAALERLGP